MKISRGMAAASQTSSSHSTRLEHAIKQLSGKIKRLKNEGEEPDAGKQMLLDSYNNQMTMLKEVQQQTKNQTHKTTSTLEEASQSNASAQSIVDGLSQQFPSVELAFSVNTHA